MNDSRSVKKMFFVTYSRFNSAGKKRSPGVNHYPFMRNVRPAGARGTFTRKPSASGFVFPIRKRKRSFRCLSNGLRRKPFSGVVNDRCLRVTGRKEIANYSLDFFSQLVGTDCTALKQPPAPNNTTQFLITDREERESSDHDTSSTAGPSGEGDGGELTSPHHCLMEQDPLSRPRCHSSAGCAYNIPHHYTTEEARSSCSEEEDIEDPEFSAVYDDCSYDRIRNLPREEVCYFCYFASLPMF